jgi:hypothetical protein
MLPGSVNNPVIRIKIDVGTSPIELYALFLNTTGSTNPSVDIDTTQIFYTGNSTIFSMSTPYDGNTFPLSTGTHYFWVTYDISDDAPICNTIDAECNTVYVSSGTQTPTVTNPSGFAVVGSCATGIITTDSSSNTIKIYPNPSLGTFNLNTQNVSVKYVEIYNMIGERVFHTVIKEGQSEIDLRHQSKGVYLVKFNDGQTFYTNQIVIE